MKTTRRYNNPMAYLLLLTLILIGHTAIAQELNFRVEFNTSQVEGTNKSVYETLKEAINDYMNTTSFTNAQFAANEKIDCQLYFTIKEYADGVMKGDIQIQSTRPVYNSAYTTTLINHRDTKIDFQYEEGNPLIHNETNIDGQLTAILDFYAYLILAVDFDSFSPRGGDPYWDKLKQIVQWGQSSGEVGWKAFEDNNNRSAVVSAFTDPQTAAYRDLIYEYHRKGLDEMALSVDKGRSVINKQLPVIKSVYEASPMSVALSLFRDSKFDELVNVYSKAPDNERTDAYNILQPIYPAESKRLEQIKKGAENK